LMPRKSASRPKASRNPVQPAAFYDTPRLLSADEKRELILAHAAARAPQDPLQRISLWTGVTVAVAVIVGGWFMTVGWQVRHTVSQSGDDVRKMTDRLNELTEQVESNPMFKATALDGPTSQAAAAELGGRIKTALEEANASSTGVRQGNLIAPSAPGSGMASDSNVSTTGISPSRVMDPKTPGLTPDR
ncbi:MAG TPA: hypothetical protein VN397_00145, partial [Candidatus Methylomirabilis sp.]|nr:hypothetical protein [Candidatus Methylomirabilis sp.]